MPGSQCCHQPSHCQSNALITQCIFSRRSLLPGICCSSLSCETSSTVMSRRRCPFAPFAPDVMDLACRVGRAECHDTPGHSDHAAKADQRIAGDRQGRSSGPSGHRRRFPLPRSVPAPARQRPHHAGNAPIPPRSDKASARGVFRFSMRHKTTYRACREKLPCYPAKNPLAQPGVSICPYDQQVGAFLLREREQLRCA